MLLDSLNYTTKSFTKIHKRTAHSVFESLVTVGDKTAALDGNYPTPSALLMARAYAETCLSFLRGSKPDIEVRREGDARRADENDEAFPQHREKRVSSLKR